MASEQKGVAGSVPGAARRRYDPGSKGEAPLAGRENCEGGGVGDEKATRGTAFQGIGGPSLTGWPLLVLASLRLRPPRRAERPSREAPPSGDDGRRLGLTSVVRRTNRHVVDVGPILPVL